MAPPVPKNEKIRPMNRPIQMPDSRPPRATRPVVSRPVTRSTCLSSVPTIMQFSTGNSWSERKSTDLLRLLVLVVDPQGLRELEGEPGLEGAHVLLAAHAPILPPFPKAGQVPQVIVIPPSTASVWPVT